MSSGSGEDVAARVRRRLIDAGHTEPTVAAIAAATRAEAPADDPAAALALLRRVRDEVVGAGPLAPYLELDDVTDVLVNAPDDVWVERAGQLQRVPVAFEDDDAVRDLVRRLLAPIGRRLDASRPWVDARLPDGTRLHAVLPPIASRGTCVSLRTLRRQRLTLADLVELGAVDPALAPWLGAMVEARLTVVVTGATGSGKTTLLACLLALADPADRIVVIEDAAELRPPSPHVVFLECRTSNVEGAGQVTMRDLVRQALRMRPDRLVVGEVRGIEVVDLLSAFNTGHSGGFTTLHANAVGEVPSRIEALAAGGGGLDAAGVRSAVAAALEVVVHLERRPVRRVAEVGVVRADRSGAVRVEPALSVGDGGLGPREGFGVLCGWLSRAGVASPPRPS